MYWQIYPNMVLLIQCKTRTANLIKYFFGLKICFVSCKKVLPSCVLSQTVYSGNSWQCVREVYGASLLRKWARNRSECSNHSIVVVVYCFNISYDPKNWIEIVWGFCRVYQETKTLLYTGQDVHSLGMHLSCYFTVVGILADLAVGVLT